MTTTRVVLVWCCVILSFAIESCQPLYWQANITYQIQNNQLEYVANKTINPNDISVTKGSPFKSNFTLSQIKGIVTYNPSQQNVTRSGDSITVTGAILDIHFDFTASSSHGGVKQQKYNGKGTAKVTGLLVNYTKVAKITNGTAGFTVTEVVSSFVSVVPNSDYTPNTTDADQFNTMVKIDLTGQIKNYFTANLMVYLNQAASKNDIPYTFDSRPYKYTYGNVDSNLTITVDTSVSYQLIPELGYTIGYNGRINGKESKCSQFKPSETNASSSYFPLQFMSNIYDEYVANYSFWQKMLIDQNNAKSTYFDFRVADIENVIESIYTTVPAAKPLDRIVAECRIDTQYQSNFSIDDSHNLLSKSAQWFCGLFHLQKKVNLLNFDVEIDYRLALLQVNNKMNVLIVEASVKNVVWKPLEGLLVSNPKLAGVYLKTLIATLNGQTTLGTGFQQPKRTAPNTKLLDDAVQVYDAATEVEV